MNGKPVNNVDPVQTPRSAASDLGLHCLLRPFFRNTLGKYSNLIKSITPSEILNPVLSDTGSGYMYVIIEGPENHPARSHSLIRFLPFCM